MKLTIIEISEDEFNNSTSILLFKDEIGNRKYGFLQGANFKLAWHSDTIKPEIKEISQNIFSIGIDQNFAIIDINSKSILLAIKLTYSFFTTEFNESNLFVATELEVIKIDLINYKIISEYALPDTFEKMISKGKGFEVLCEGNISISIS